MSFQKFEITLRDGREALVVGISEDGEDFLVHIISHKTGKPQQSQIKVPRKP